MKLNVGFIKVISLLILANVSYSFLNVFGKKASLELSSITVQSYRVWISLPVLLVTALVLDRDPDNNFWSTFNLESFLRTGLVSLIILVVNNNLYMLGLSLVSPVQAVGLFLLVTVWTSLYMMLFRGESKAVMKIVGIFLAIGGAFGFVDFAEISMDSMDDLIGSLMLLLATFLFTVYFLFTKTITKDIPAASATFWIFFQASLIQLASLYNIDEFDIVNYSKDLWISLILTAIAGTAIPFM
eukprot:TRINITY_DN5971_c0_g1_i1.p1 TRINITY_DN5971_c0_g1~~TRINITY_DN5971_c0_g1_i1.p1  ORF type:complete len:242 (+),score=32.28 TRINITY_DN5971_c0_g1_i1:1-726(+)